MRLFGYFTRTRVISPKVTATITPKQANVTNGPASSTNTKVLEYPLRYIRSAAESSGIGSPIDADAVS